MASPSKFGSFEAAMARNSLDTLVQAFRRKLTVLSLSLAQALARPSVSEFESSLFNKTYTNLVHEFDSLLVENGGDPTLGVIGQDLKALHVRLAHLIVAEPTHFQRMKAKVHLMCSSAVRIPRPLLQRPPFSFSPFYSHELKINIVRTLSVIS